MASSASLAAANPPLSYAERAKKAQNARPPQPTHRSMPASTSSTAPIPSTSSVARTPSITSPPPPPKPSSSGPPGSDPRTSSTTTHAPPPSSSKLAISPPASTALEVKPNGDASTHGDPSPVPSSPFAGKQSAAPSTNVWTVRKEQMAAKALTQSRPSQSSSQPASNLQSPPPASVQATASSSSMNSSTNVPANPVKSSLPAALPSTNGHLVPAPEDDDPFVVKPGRSPATLTVSPPAIDDTESWPEVGQAAATPLNGKKEGREEDEKGHEREASQGQGLKKSTFIFPLSLPPKISTSVSIYELRYVLTGLRHSCLCSCNRREDEMGTCTSGSAPVRGTCSHAACAAKVSEPGQEQ